VTWKPGDEFEAVRQEEHGPVGENQMMRWNASLENLGPACFCLSSLFLGVGRRYGRRPTPRARCCIGVVITRAGDDLDIRTRSTGRTVLSLEASGEYSLGSGGMVDVELEPERLSGYITR